MTSLPRTPSNKFSSEGNIPASVSVEHTSTRKRKQPDNDDLKFLEGKFDDQMLLWNKQITECISSSITVAVNSALSIEFAKITSALSEINNNIIKLNADNVCINKSLTDANYRMNEIDQSLHFSSERQDTFDARLKTTEDNAAIAASSVAQVRVLENKVWAMEQQARQCNIEISNLPERRNENLVAILDCLGGAIKLPIRSSDIVAVHRVPHVDQRDHRPKNIIVKFNNRMLRDNVIAAYRATKGLDSTKIAVSGPPATFYVNEHLTLNNKLLFRQCREVAKKLDFKYVWVKHGTILTRKSDTSPVVAIRSSQDIAKIR
ncbi:Zinc finger DNA binding protein [Operophtera brumata]|uniref:Zinc finger DNA binding protein n=1 Tax=Operophtera brumata TaxID=104452 RepID=A0A0L7LQ84_OPEBR|nr:Zinc finger DNA binding protein [Operophtera brumata]